MSKEVKPALLSANSLPLLAFREGHVQMALDIMTMGTETTPEEALLLLHDSVMAAAAAEVVAMSQDRHVRSIERHGYLGRVRHVICEASRGGDVEPGAWDMILKGTREGQRTYVALHKYHGLSEASRPFWEAYWKERGFPLLSRGEFMSLPIEERLGL